MTKVALISGAARRVGAAIARRFHQENINVVIHYRGSAVEADQLCVELNSLRKNSALSIQAELSDFLAFPSLIEAISNRFGRLDILVNNASAFYPSTIGMIDESHWDQLFDTNLKAPFFLAQAAAPILRLNAGCIVNLVDIHGQRPLKGYPLYSVTKSALSAMTRALAKELAPDIRVNGVAPGAILWPENEMTHDEKARILDKIPFKRIGCLDDITSAVSYLVHHAPYVTGQILTVDGGRVLDS